MKRFLLAFFLLMSGAAGVAHADTFPSRRITIVVPFAPGGALDIVARIVGDGMSKRLGQTVIVENRAGASGMIGARYVAASNPDGYTLMFAVSTVMAVAPATLKNTDFVPVKSLAPVVEIARGPFLFLVASSVPAKSLAEFIAYAKNAPNTVNYGSVGVGSTHQFIGALLNRNAGLKLFHVPYKGSGQVYTGILGGQVQAMFDTMPGPISYIDAGSLRPLAVTGDKRLDRLPNVPTFAEQGVPGMDIEFSYGLVGPNGMPQDVVQKLNDGVTQTLDDPEVRQRLQAQDVVPSPGTAAQYGDYLVNLAARWKQIIQDTGFRPLD